MKCLAFVDLHGEWKAYKNIRKIIKKEKPDFLLCAGDFTIFENQIKWMMHKLSKLDGKIFLVHGNHEEGSVVKRIAEHYKNIEFVHERIAEFNDVVVLGWGGGGFTIRDEEFESWIRGIRKRLKMYKKEGKKIILVSHAPFYKTNLDIIADCHHGNKSLTNFIKEFRVDIGICGHFHENWGKEDKIRNCRVYNPGPQGKLIEI